MMLTYNTSREIYALYSVNIDTKLITVFGNIERRERNGSYQGSISWLMFIDAYLRWVTSEQC